MCGLDLLAFAIFIENNTNFLTSPSANRPVNSGQARSRVVVVF
jgi:hypothetical protein